MTGTDDTEVVIELYGATLGEGAYVGGYVIEHLVGSGGHGAVYRARHAATGALAAIKLLHARLQRSTMLRARFAQEAATLAALDHAGIVRVSGTGTLDDGRPFYVMEWIPGQTLAEELSRRGRLSVQEALLTCAHVGEALAAAHARGVVHRDLKARNVIIVDAATRQLKLIDFGVAKVSSPLIATTVHTTATVIGSPATMAPEQLRGEPVDSRTDVYGLGILLFQMITGRLPFAGSDLVELEERQMHAPPPAASALVGTPVRLDAVIARAMAKDKAARHASAEDFLADAWAAVQGPPVGTAQGPPVGTALCARVRADGDAGGEAGGDAGGEAGGENRRDDDALDQALDDAAARMRDAGLTIALELGDGVLGVLAGGDGDTVARVLACAQALCHPALALTVHLDQAELDGDTVTGGPLLDLARWLPAPVFGRIALTAGAAAQCPAAQLSDPRLARA
jgi:predicted Ser/Thr protein kinase